MHAEILGTRAVRWPDEAACAECARALAAHSEITEACIELHGPLGAGKTTFVRHLLRSLGVDGRIKSPSYAVVEPYELEGLKAWHFDFYRFGDPREWEDAGFRDIFAGRGLKLVEWPEHAGDLLPAPDLRLDIRPAIDADARSVTIEACTPRGVRMLSTEHSK
jgi:tRNA threonylcarbamoyladenosine biosynthesis protein TsaE